MPHLCLGRTLPLALTASLLLVMLGTPPAWADPDHGADAGQQADKSPSDVASAWFEALYDVVKAERTPPPPAARIYGITAVSLYEAIVAGTRRHRSLVGQLNGLTSVPRPQKPKKYHWPTVANTVLASTIRGLYPTLSQASLDAINTLEERFASQYKAEILRQTYDSSVQHGQAVARAILAWAAGDGLSTYSNCPYVPVPVPGAWERTPPFFNAKPLQPCWGEIRPMVLTSGEECQPPGHPAFSTDSDSDFYAAALEVYTVGLDLTEEQKTIADFWADGAGATGTPPGHWIAIVSQLSRRDAFSLATATEAYARVGIAVHDAFIACWNTKYLYNLQRPVTYINEHINSAWTPYITTPEFPSYHSGHSTQSGAAARVLTDMLGRMSFTDTTHTDHGLVPPQAPRTFRSFNTAAAEAAVSRLYGGIHFTFDNADGLASGRCIGDMIRKHVQFRK